nr:uncharacterized protein LOC116429225 [Nomia melanderi]
MKCPQLLALACCLALAEASQAAESAEQDLLSRASAQLERLAPYRRSSSEGASTDQWQSLEPARAPENANLDERRVALEIYRVLPEDLQEDIVRRGQVAVMELLADPKYMALIEHKPPEADHGTKRDGYTYSEYEGPPEAEHPPEGYGGYAHEHYGGEYYGDQPAGSDSGGIIKGSTSLISGIAKGLIGGLVSASGSASKGSSSVSATSSAQASSSSSSSSTEQKRPAYGHYGHYGPAYPYGHKEFDVWDFKKAIISTLMQAVKAISGGVIALKGQLIKGSGYLVSTKGKIISSTGDAITSLGRNIAKNAVHPPEPSHTSYAYEHPPEGGHEESYDGPPPSIEEYSEPTDGYHANSNYESSSDVGEHAGLLIAKPTEPENHDEHEDLHPRKPAPHEDKYHGPPPELTENTVSGNTHGFPGPGQPEHPVESPHPPSSYEVPLHHRPFDDAKKGHEYLAYPPLAAGLPVGGHNALSIQQSVEYPPVHIRYTLPIKGNLKLPVDTSGNDLSVYGSVSIDTEPEIEPTKVHTVNPLNGLELPKLQPHGNFHGLPPLLPGAYAPATQEPLKIPLLNPYAPAYWQGHGFLQPYAGFDMYGLYRRRNSANRRRSVNDVLRRMRLPRG